MKTVNKFKLLVLLAVTVACDKPYTGEPALMRSVLVYMVGDNSLSKYCEENIKAITAGVKNTFTEYNSVYVYCDKTDSNPVLLRLHKNGNSVKCDTVIKYPETNSASHEQLAAVITDAYANNRYDSYGLILWSHATGWLPPCFSDGEFVTQSFGRDNGYEMDIKDLAAALPDSFFEFIIFDACNMGAVEVAYQLRGKTQFILSPTTEIAAEGLPYKQIIPALLSKNTNYKTRRKHVTIII
ncbi:MAG: hypothetical protein LBP85_04765 [Prevotellaceae bacterium]|jgi:hypothetical protein|nr:hypothetical protein [Prevotellaceae bacterium]